MSIYLVTQQNFINEERYRKYEAAFPAVFAKFKGKVLVADESPIVLEGDWTMNKIVILEFANKSDAKEFSTSPEYQAIQGDRIAGTSGCTLLANGIE